MDWQIPLLVSAMVFAGYLVFKFRPAFGPDGRTSAAALREARARIEAAKDDVSRALALCDAADASVQLGMTTAAVGLYLRALRADPRSTAVVERAAASLARRPRALESLMWRHLGAEPWTGEGREAALAALRVLAATYAKRPRFAPRARALEHALAALDERR